MQKYYEMKIAGLPRQLPLCRVNDTLMIAAFVIFGDAPLTVACAEELLRRAPEYDYLITAEAKGIPLAHEMARQRGDAHYFIARKHPKLYMDTADAERMRGKKILIVDDVISTGESLAAVEKLVQEAGGIVAGKMAILAEGDAQSRSDIAYLEPLPLFDGSGNVME